MMMTASQTSSEEDDNLGSTEADPAEVDDAKEVNHPLYDVSETMEEQGEEER